MTSAEMTQLLQTGMPPSNLSFLIAAFVVTGLAFIGYIFFIFRRRQEARGEIDRLLEARQNSKNSGREDS